MSRSMLWIALGVVQLLNQKKMMKRMVLDVNKIEAIEIILQIFFSFSFT